ncbi:MAG: 2-phosphosulfolactate phosphatase [Candidatus Cloacimonetes bacterium]|nr:2-phosphosulfolactate phosphatase [Candidatus Cloacimonadota bacterium]
MKIKILPLLEGAVRAEGIAVVIDVFRAFSLECYLYHLGVKEVIPVASLENALRLKRQHPDFLLFGEKMGLNQQGFDFGNSPFYAQQAELKGKSIIHSTSSGTRGLLTALASQAEIVITGSYVNAAAIARYILDQQPEKVTLIPMGWACEYVTQEDQFCAEYIISLLKSEPDPHPDYMIELYETDGKRFFNPENQQSMPIADFFLCLQRNIFDFILKAEQDKTGIVKLQKIDI